MYIGKIVVALVGVVLVMLVGACDIGSPTKQPDLTPAQVIEKAGPAMQAANSFHFSMEASKLDQLLPGIYISKASGDVQKPDKLSADVNAIAYGVPVNIKAVVDGDKQYMTDPGSGAWMSSSLMIDVKQYFNPDKGVADILNNVKDLKSEGKESVDNTDSYKLSGKVPASALESLSPVVTAKDDITTTLWIGAGDYLLRQVRLDGPIDASEPPNTVRTITFSDYNKPMKIETPVIK